MTTTTTVTPTHIIRAFSALRYVQHHHREVKRNRMHAVVATPRGVYEGACVETACGAEVRVEDTGEALTCRKITEGDLKYVDCKDCRKKLGL